MTMTQISTVTVGSGGASSITFSSIPDTYTDLLLKLSLRATHASVTSYALLSFNSSTANFSIRALGGNGSSAFSYTSPGNFAGETVGNNATSNTFSSGAIYIPNYTASSAKSFSIDAIGENNATLAQQSLVAGLWNVTDAVTSITLTPVSGTWMQYSSASLYGIRKYNTTLAPKASGGIISYDSVNNKWVHVFTASGTFTPTENLSGVEYLVVAGGGGGGFYYGAGGGAGGYRSSVTGESSGGGASAESTLSLTASTNYTVTVGAGGAGANSSTFRGSSGNDSVFGSITAIGGGGGGGASPFVGSAATAPGLSGGSGGGAGGERGAQSGGAGTAGQGYAGEDTPGAYQGGGGGAGEAGGTDGGKQGGDGVSSSITGSAVTRAGGGGGGSSAGGDGGGGAGGVAGTANTGGGGGGDNGGNGMAGGSGIVIVRYSA